MQVHMLSAYAHASFLLVFLCLNDGYTDVDIPLPLWWAHRRATSAKKAYSVSERRGTESSSSLLNQSSACARD